VVVVKKRLIVIEGPTGAGKTALSIALAKHFNTEVISADSRQIYQGMTIGTAAIKPEEMQGVPQITSSYAGDRCCILMRFVKV